MPPLNAKFAPQWSKFSQNLSGKHAIVVFGTTTLMTETTKGGGISIGDVFPSLLILPGLDFENKTYFNWTKNNHSSLRSKSNGVCKTREV